MTKISIIIPVYNVEKYLKNCLKSIVKQSLKEIQIIIINDCSTDNSPAIIYDIAKNDKRIVLINNKKNLGCSNSKAIGLQKATGKYICFIDGDDQIGENMLEILFNYIENKELDLVIFNAISEKNKQKLIKKDNIKINKDKKINIQNLILSNNLGIPATWNKIWKNEIIKNNNINFITNIKISGGEDYLFFIDFLNKTNKIDFLDKDLYIYNDFNINNFSNNFYPEEIESREKFLYELNNKNNIYNIFNKKQLEEIKQNFYLLLIVKEILNTKKFIYTKNLFLYIKNNNHLTENKKIFIKILSIHFLLAYLIIKLNRFIIRLNKIF